MPGKSIAIAQRESYEISSFTEFLWWLSTAEKEILIDSVVDRNRYRIIGMTVLGTWIFATLSWTYFFSTIANSLIISICLGMFMGLMILIIDRALIKGITKFNKKRFAPLVFRALLAITIGSFMAQPAILFMFDKEIKLQTSLDNEKRKLIKQQEMELLYKKQKEELVFQMENYQQELTDKNEAVDKARQQFLAEIDGSGGTGKIGIKDIAIAKRDEYEKLDEELTLTKKSLQPKIDALENSLALIDNKIKKEATDFEQYLNHGFLTRIEALKNLLDANDALKFRYYLIIFILILIELMPVIAKTLLPSGSYDEKVRLREAMEIEIARSNSNHEQKLKEHYNQWAYDTDTDSIKTFFKLTKDDRDEKMRALSKKWKEGNDGSFDGFWEKIKTEMLTKQEN